MFLCVNQQYLHLLLVGWDLFQRRWRLVGLKEQNINLLGVEING